MYCKKCGNELLEGVLSCPKCGADVPPEDLPEYTREDDRKSKDFKYYIEQRLHQLTRHSSIEERLQAKRIEGGWETPLWSILMIVFVISIGAILAGFMNGLLTGFLLCIPAVITGLLWRYMSKRSWTVVGMGCEDREALVDFLNVYTPFISQELCEWEQMDIQEPFQGEQREMVGCYGKSAYIYIRLKQTSQGEIRYKLRVGIRTSARGTAGAVLLVGVKRAAASKGTLEDIERRRFAPLFTAALEYFYKQLQENASTD